MGPERSTGFGSIPTATSGAAGSNGAPSAKPEELDGVKIFNPRARPSASSTFPSAAQIWRSGGPKKNRLFMASSHSLYALYVEARGAV